MLLVIFPISYLLSPSFTVVALLYLLVNLAYSNWLKHIPLVDVLILAMGFVLRVGAGVTLISVERFSPWLYICMTMLALFMGFGKRRAELSLLAGDANSHRKVLEGYTIPFLDQLIMIVSSTTIISYILYTILAPSMPANHSMMLTIPFVVYAIFRYLYLVQVRGKGGAPEDLVLTDRPFQISLVLWALSVFIIFYLLS
jgi:4-hydroxybenzoate polyprenyltransferase